MYDNRVFSLILTEIKIVIYSLCALFLIFLGNLLPQTLQNKTI